MTAHTAPTPMDRPALVFCGGAITPAQELTVRAIASMVGVRGVFVTTLSGGDVRLETIEAPGDHIRFACYTPSDDGRFIVSPDGTVDDDGLDWAIGQILADRWFESRGLRDDNSRSADPVCDYIAIAGTRASELMSAHGTWAAPYRPIA